MEAFKSLLDRNEIRRLEKAAREKNKKHLVEWAIQFEQSIHKMLDKEHEQETQISMDIVMIAVAYTLYFSEETVIKDKKDISEFMADLFVTIDLYRTGEYKPQEYEDILKGVGVIIDSYNYSKPYKDKIAKLDTLIKQYEDLIQQKSRPNLNNNPK